jgi:hypothetical protein
MRAMASWWNHGKLEYFITGELLLFLCFNTNNCFKQKYLQNNITPKLVKIKIPNTSPASKFTQHKADPETDSRLQAIIQSTS